MNPITEREHADLEGRVGKVENRLEKVEDRVDKVEGRFDRLDGMVILVKVIFGASVVSAIAGVLALVDLLSHRLPA